MSRMFHCPTCKKPVEVDDDTPQLLAEVVRPLTEAVKGLPAQFPQHPELPPNLAETLEKVAQAGQHMETLATSWEAQRKAEAETGGHSVPTPEDIEHFRTCPDCSPAWQKIWDGIAAEARTGYIPTEEAKTTFTELAQQLTGAKRRA